MNAKAKENDNSNQQSFNADVARLLDIVANALYTNHDVFLRELISNAADACDRLRYEAIQKPAITEGDADFRIHIYRNADRRELTVVDNGIGMSEKELADNLGTIAKSGTKALMEASQKKKDADPLKLIGQFGVGFYAGYMVADFIRVISRKAGNKKTFTWESDGASGFTVRAATKEETESLDGERGTAVILNIKDAGADFLIPDKIEQTIKQYSDHISVSIYLVPPEERNEADKPVNQASALWTRPRDRITEEQYNEFYKHISHGFDEPTMTSHWRAEGKIEFTALLYVPTMRPFDLYDPGRKNAVNLYVRRVFISDYIDGLMYPWLRFVRGVIDSEDLPLNISRESLQYNPLIAKIRTAVTKRILNDLDKLSRDDEMAFLTFWGQFGPAIKEGLYDATDHRESIFKICRFGSTRDGGDNLVSLEEYIEKMKPGQDKIYYMSGENKDSLMNSPQIEGFKAKGIEVLFFTDTIDDFWLQQAPEYKDFAFQSVTKGNIDFADNKSEKEEGNNNKEKETEQNSAQYSDFLGAVKELLSEDVEDVRASKRLTESPVCLIAPDTGVDLNMERVLKIHQKYTPGNKPVLELNMDHTLVKKMIKMKSGTDFEDLAYIMLDQAKIFQGETPKDPVKYSQRLSRFIEKGLA